MRQIIRIAIYATVFAGVPATALTAQNIVTPGIADNGSVLSTQTAQGEPVFTSRGDLVGSIVHSFPGDDGRRQFVLLFAPSLGLGERVVFVPEDDLVKSADDSGYETMLSIDELAALPGHGAGR